MVPIIQYLIIHREVLAPGHGVLAAQAAHAAVAGYLIAADTDSGRAWAGGTFTKIILAVGDESALSSQLASAGIVHKLLEESWLQGRATAIGVAPLPKSAVAPILGRLPLFK